MAVPIPSDVPIEEYVAFEDDNNPPYPILDDDANALPMQARNTRTRSAAICSAISQSNTQYYLKKLQEDIAKNPALTQKCVKYNRRKIMFLQRQSLFSLTLVGIILTITIMSLVFITDATELVNEFYDQSALPLSVVTVYTATTSWPGLVIIPFIALLTLVMWLTMEQKFKPKAEVMTLNTLGEMAMAFISACVPFLLALLVFIVVVCFQLRFASLEQNHSLYDLLVNLRQYIIADALLSGPSLIVLQPANVLGVSGIAIHVLALLTILYTVNILRAALFNINQATYAVATALYAFMTMILLVTFHDTPLEQRNYFWFQLYTVGIYTVQGLVSFVEIMLRPACDEEHEEDEVSEDEQEPAPATN